MRGDKMKVFLTTLNSKYSHINIAPYYLKHCIEDICEVIVKEFTINDGLDHILENILLTHSDMICFGCYIWNIEQTEKIIKNLHQLRPDIKIALGGPEVSYSPEDMLQKYPYLYAIMCGEGENSIRQLVQDSIQNKAKKIYTIPVSSEEIPLVTDDILANYDNRVVYFESSRGCPYRCSYCLSCIDKNIKYFDRERNKQELTKLLDHNVKQIRFLDRTFNSNRERALELWKFLIDNRQDTTFHFEICVNLIDETTLTFLKTVPDDVFQFEIGVQSTNPQTLETIHRGYRWKKEKEMLQALRKLDTIKLHTDLIIGLPYETLAIFQDSFRELYTLHPHEIQIGFLKLLKGSDIYNQVEEFQYKFTTMPPYEVLENQFISYEEVRFLKKFETIFELYYNSGFFSHTIGVLESCFEDPYLLYESITQYYIAHHLFDRKISTDESFEIISHMFQEHKIYPLLQQALTYDYFLKFKGQRDYFFNRYQEDLKDILNTYIEDNRDILFAGKRNTEIYKAYKFLVLDYDFIEQTSSEKTIYCIPK